jgi:hypothetical protein
MSKIDLIKNRLIDRILVSNDLELLETAERLFVSDKKNEFFHLSSEEIEMLVMSEDDIRYGRIISEDEVD